MIKKTLSWALVVPALIIICSEVKDINLEWVRLLAILILIGVAIWNDAFKSEQIPNRRKNNENNNYYRYLARREDRC